ncbi:MAG: response regulator transcription factor [Clostridia bacterium]|nr:response regulator transcription factor [Clostridia bacterium]
MKILITDDEQEIRKVLRLLLEERGYTVCEAYDGAYAVRMLKEDSSIDLCIMDIMMPNMSGIEATREIRTFSTVPILFLTARSLDKDKEEAYTGGGDDYLVKPFSTKELLMKVEALTRRYNNYTPKAESEGAIRIGGGILIYPESREVTKNGSPVDIRDKEYDLLLFLSRHRGEVLSPQRIYEGVWGEMPLPSSNNTITVHILNLRRKLEDGGSSSKIIRTVWGKGYQVD